MTPPTIKRKKTRTSRTSAPSQPAPTPITGVEIANRVMDRMTEGMSLTDLTALLCGCAYSHGFLAARLASQAGVPAADFRAAAEAAREQWLSGAAVALEAVSRTEYARAVKRMARTCCLDAEAPSCPQSDAANEVAA